MKGKKLSCIVIALLVVCCMSLPVFAQWYENNDIGISFTLNGSWNVEKLDNRYDFEHYSSTFERIFVEGSESNEYLPMELIEDGDLLELLDNVYSNANLIQGMREANPGAGISGTQDLRKYGREVCGDREYFRYEKVLTFHAPGYYDQQVYFVSYVTIVNGRLYEFHYERPSQQNHYSEFMGILDSVNFESGEIKIYIQGERIYPDSAPFLIEGRTLVPIRAVAEAMGYDVEWFEEEMAVVMTSMDGRNELSFKIGQGFATKNGTKMISLDVPAVIVGSRTYLPLRAVAEAMDAKVDWSDAEQAVYIAH